MDTVSFVNGINFMDIFNHAANVFWLQKYYNNEFMPSFAPFHFLILRNGGRFILDERFGDFSEKIYLCSRFSPKRAGLSI